MMRVIWLTAIALMPWCFSCLTGASLKQFQGNSNIFVHNCKEFEKPRKVTLSGYTHLFNMRRYFQLEREHTPIQKDQLLDNVSISKVQVIRFYNCTKSDYDGQLAYLITTHDGDVYLKFEALRTFYFTEAMSQRAMVAAASSLPMSSVTYVRFGSGSTSGEACATLGMNSDSALQHYMNSLPGGIRHNQKTVKRWVTFCLNGCASIWWYPDNQAFNIDNLEGSYDIVEEAEFDPLPQVNG